MDSFSRFLIVGSVVVVYWFFLKSLSTKLPFLKLARPIIEEGASMVESSIWWSNDCAFAISPMTSSRCNSFSEVYFSIVSLDILDSIIDDITKLP